MPFVSVLGRNLPAVIAATVLVATGGLVASADLVGPTDEPTVVTSVEPSVEPSPEPSVEQSVEQSIEPSDDPSPEESVESSVAPSVLAVEPSGEPAVEGVGPDPTGPAGHGLCNAWSKGGLGEGSTARRNLEEAAGGAEAVEAFCAVVLQEKEARRGRPDHAGPPSADDGDRGPAKDRPAKEGPASADEPGKANEAARAGKPEKPEKLDEADED